MERPAVGKEELKSMKQDGGKKSEKRRETGGSGEDRGLYGSGATSSSCLLPHSGLGFALGIFMLWLNLKDQMHR